jgi:hypothetical protein
MGLYGFRKRHSIGPVEVATGRNRRTNRDGVMAVCTNDGCGWSAVYDTQEAADLAAQSHRCSPR